MSGHPASGFHNLSMPQSDQPEHAASLQPIPTLNSLAPISHRHELLHNHFASVSSQICLFSLDKFSSVQTQPSSVQVAPGQNHSALSPLDEIPTHSCSDEAIVTRREQSAQIAGFESGITQISPILLEISQEAANASGQQEIHPDRVELVSELVPARILAIRDLNDMTTINSFVNDLDSRHQPNGRKQRVEINKGDDKAKLVKLCNEHFDLYKTGKMKFFDLMRVKYWVITNLDVNVKGYMERWEKKRRTEVEMDRMKSGVARSYGEWEISLDIWIAAVDDLEKERSTEKSVRDKEALAAMDEKIRLEDIRENMMKTINDRKRKHDEVFPDDVTGEKDNREERQVPNGSKKARVEKALMDIKEGDLEIIEYLRESDANRMNRWEALLTPMITRVNQSNIHSSDPVILERLDRQESRMQRYEDKLDKLLDLMLSGREKPE